MNFTERWTLPSGTPLKLRPVCAHDAPALNHLIESLPRQDLRWRFHGAVSGIPPAQLARMVCVDPVRDLALVVTAPAPGGEQLIADARCAIDRTGQQAEFAVMVAASWRRRGIGQRALSALNRAAALRGLRWLYGSVQADNAPMLALMQHLRFTCSPHRADAKLVAVEARVEQPFPSSSSSTGFRHA